MVISQCEVFSDGRDQPVRPADDEANAVRDEGEQRVALVGYVEFEACLRKDDGAGAG